MARSPKQKAQPRLKVYVTAIGLHDALVAAPSQKAALKAWGTTTDLFAAGRASVVEDPELTAEPLARPGEVVRRLRGNEAAMLGPEPAEPFTPARKRAEKPAKPGSERSRPLHRRRLLHVLRTAAASTRPSGSWRARRSGSRRSWLAWKPSALR